MSIFIGIAGLLVLLGVAVLTPAILRRHDALAESSNVQRDNIAIAQDRLSEIERDLRSGDIDQDIFDAAKAELEQGLLLDIGDSSTKTERLHRGYGRSAWVGLALLVPLLAFGIYRSLGAPQYMDVTGPGQVVAQVKKKLPTMDELIPLLEARLQQTPDDAEGWFMLGRAHAGMGDYQQAVVALEKAVTLSGNHYSAQIALADALAMTKQGQVNGRPLELVNAVLVQQPDNLTALWMAGKGARQRGDYQVAIDYWQQVIPGVSAEPAVLAELQGLIEDTRQQAAQTGVELSEPVVSAEPKMAAGVPLQIEIAPELLDKIPGDAILFIFAKRVQGPPMPVAAIRRSAAELPLAITLDDSHILTPGGRLNDFDQLRIGARVSLSGQPIAQTGDLQSQEQIFSPAESTAVTLLIDQVVTR